MKVADLTKALESLAPLALQESYDNAGLLVGDPSQEVDACLCTIDISEKVIDEAISKGVGLIIAHHPLIFSGLKKVTPNNPVQRVIIKAIKHDIALYACHTNLDNVIDGVNGKIASILGIKEPKVLSPIRDNLSKLVCYTPKSEAEKVRQAMFNAGAGRIGQYDACSFNTDGLGSFRALEGANPHVGQIGAVHFESETKIETIVPRYLLSGTIRAMIESHPYEEVAYDIYPLSNFNLSTGAGIIGMLETEKGLNELLSELKSKFDAQGIRYKAKEGQKIKKLAVCGGSGSFLINEAAKQGADAFITGDIKYHQFFDAPEKMALIDIGHYESEQFTKEIFYEALKKKFPKFAVHLSEVKTNPIKYY